MMVKKHLACTECHMNIEVQQGNPGWWLKSNNSLKAMNKKQLAILAFISDTFVNILIPKCRRIVAKVTKAILRGFSADMTSLLGTFSVYLWYLNHMNILITIFPFRDVSTSNGSPFIHMNGSHPIGDFS